MNNINIIQLLYFIFLLLVISLISQKNLQNSKINFLIMIKDPWWVFGNIILLLSVYMLYIYKPTNKEDIKNKKKFILAIHLGMYAYIIAILRTVKFTIAMTFFVTLYYYHFSKYFGW